MSIWSFKIHFSWCSLFLYEVSSKNTTLAAPCQTELCSAKLNFFSKTINVSVEALDYHGFFSRNHLASNTTVNIYTSLTIRMPFWLYPSCQLCLNTVWSRETPGKYQRHKIFWKNLSWDMQQVTVRACVRRAPVSFFYLLPLRRQRMKKQCMCSSMRSTGEKSAAPSIFFQFAPPVCATTLSNLRWK